MQDADAADLTQDVLRAVSNSIGHFEYDPEVGRFRSWLFTIARNTLSNWLRSAQRKQTGTGDPMLLSYLQELPRNDSGDDDVWEQEYRRHLFQWASKRVCADFADKTWSAFWRTAVDGASPAVVASELEMSVGAVYVAKNRVMTKLRQKIATVDDSFQD